MRLIQIELRACNNTYIAKIPQDFFVFVGLKILFEVQLRIWTWHNLIKCHLCCSAKNWQRANVYLFCFGRLLCCYSLLFALAMTVWGMVTMREPPPDKCMAKHTRGYVLRVLVCVCLCVGLCLMWRGDPLYGHEFRHVHTHTNACLLPESCVFSLWVCVSVFVSA